jgi:hypothetical protein
MRQIQRRTDMAGTAILIRRTAFATPTVLVILTGISRFEFIQEDNKAK